jgi:hypothetical protein
MTARSCIDLTTPHQNPRLGLSRSPSGIDQRRTRSKPAVSIVRNGLHAVEPVLHRPGRFAFNVHRKPHLRCPRENDKSSPMKPIVTRKKPPIHHELIEDPEEQVPPGWPDTDGLSGEGSESALAHLRDQENKRIDRSDKAE